MGEIATPLKKQRKLRRESNPILIKELRGRMRGARAFVVLTVYLLLLTCFTSLIYYVYVANTSGPSVASEMSNLGKIIFSSVVLIEIFTVTFITPAFTAGAISGERERKTYELLRTTLLSARKLVTGKLTATLTYVLLLILAAVPMEGLAFVFGGVTPGELGAALILLLATALAFAAIGITGSSFLRTTRASNTLASVTATLLTIGLPVLILTVMGLVDALWYDTADSLPWIAEAALVYLGYFCVGLSPVSAAIGTEIILDDQNSLLYFWHNIDSTHRVLIPSFWIIYTVNYLLLALILLLIAVLRVRRQEKR